MELKLSHFDCHEKAYTNPCFHSKATISFSTLICPSTTDAFSAHQTFSVYHLHVIYCKIHRQLHNISPFFTFYLKHYLSKWAKCTDTHWKWADEQRRTKWEKKHHLTECEVHNNLPNALTLQTTHILLKFGGDFSVFLVNDRKKNGIFFVWKSYAMNTWIQWMFFLKLCINYKLSVLYTVLFYTLESVVVHSKKKCTHRAKKRRKK